MKTLAIVTTHPIQYNAPVFRMLAIRKNISIKVFYTCGIQSHNNYDPGFGITIEWDIPLMEGYEHVFVENTSSNPGSHHYGGIINPTLAQEVLDWHPDAVLVYGWNYHSHIRLIRKLKGNIPVWFRGDSNLNDPIPWWKHLLKRTVLTMVYRNVDFAFYVGTLNKEYYRKCGLKEKQLLFAPHAIDNERFFNSKINSYDDQASKWRERLGLTSEDLVVLYAGKFELKKNPTLLLKAVRAFNLKNQINLKLLFVGNGALEQSLKTDAQQNKEVMFLDFQNQSQMPVIYRLGDIFCLPSSGPGETWGLAINEALASGIPVIVSNRVGCSFDLVKPGLTGLVFESNNVDHLLECIEKMVIEIQKNFYRDKPKAFIQNWSFEKQLIAFEQHLMRN